MLQAIIIWHTTCFCIWREKQLSDELEYLILSRQLLVSVLKLLWIGFYPWCLFVPYEGQSGTSGKKFLAPLKVMQCFCITFNCCWSVVTVKRERLYCGGLMLEGQGSGDCCYAAESPWTRASPTGGQASLFYVMIQRFICGVLGCEEPRCNKQSLCQFPNLSSTP